MNAASNLLPVQLIPIDETVGRAALSIGIEAISDKTSLLMQSILLDEVGGGSAGGGSEGGDSFG